MRGRGVVEEALHEGVEPVYPGVGGGGGGGGGGGVFGGGGGWGCGGGGGVGEGGGGGWDVRIELPGETILGKKESTWNRAAISNPDLSPPTKMGGTGGLKGRRSGRFRPWSPWEKRNTEGLTAG